MSEQFEALVHLIHGECINLILDYLEDEIDFKTALNKFEQTKSKLSHDQLDLEDLLNDEQYQELQDINNLLEERVITLYDQTIEYPLSEKMLKKKLIELLNESKS